MSEHAICLHLEQIRRRKGVSLESIRDATKISTRFLQAIEAEEFDKLPGGVFNTSYLKQYASAIGYSGEELIAYYFSRVKPEEVVPAVAASSRFGGPRSWINWFRGPSTANG